MPSGPYSIFHKAADHLVKEHLMQRSRRINSDTDINPVIVVLYGMLDQITDIPSPYSKDKTSPVLVLSHLEDSAGLIPECEGMNYQIGVSHRMTLRKAEPGDRVKIHALMGIKPHGRLGNGDWRINYHQDKGSYRLGFKSVVDMEKS